MPISEQGKVTQCWVSIEWLHEELLAVFYIVTSFRLRMLVACILWMVDLALISFFLFYQKTFVFSFILEYWILRTQILLSEMNLNYF